jgi:hypothetical protein
LLAHVMTHEITHVLEGINRHSETGMMKGQWTETDYRAMAAGLRFAPVDVALIHDGLAKRTRLADAAASAEYHGEL